MNPLGHTLIGKPFRFYSEILGRWVEGVNGTPEAVRICGEIIEAAKQRRIADAVESQVTP